MSDAAVHVLITGRVQGVGYRAWAEREAVKRGLSGWVRNVSDGSVEAMFSGSEETVAEMLDACRHGPEGSRVVEIRRISDAAPISNGFLVLPTV